MKFKYMQTFLSFPYLPAKRKCKKARQRLSGLLNEKRAETNGYTDKENSGTNTATPAVEWHFRLGLGEKP